MSELLWVKRHSDLNHQHTSLLLSDLERLSSMVNTSNQNSIRELPTSVFPLGQLNLVSNMYSLTTPIAPMVGA